VKKVSILSIPKATTPESPFAHQPKPKKVSFNETVGKNVTAGGGAIDTGITIAGIFGNIGTTIAVIGPGIIEAIFKAVLS